MSSEGMGVCGWLKIGDFSVHVAGGVIIDRVVVRFSLGYEIPCFSNRTPRKSFSIRVTA